MIVKFSLDKNSADRVLEIGQKLVDLRDFMAASELFIIGNLPEQAVNALILAQEWAKAKRVGFFFNYFNIILGSERVISRNGDSRRRLL